jgi:hypothetical protein
VKQFLILVSLIFAISSPIMADEMPMILKISPAPNVGHCTFSVRNISAPCVQAVYMGFNEAHRSNFSAQITSTYVVGFSGTLSLESQIGEQSMNIDRVMIGQDAVPVKANGECRVTFSETINDIEHLVCHASTARGDIGFEITHARSSLIH